MGKKPLARWRHSASIYDGTQIIIFGGYYTASLRLSDVWVFDTVAMEWQQPHLIKILVLSLMVVILHQALGQVFLPLVEVILQLLLGIQCSYLAVMAATVQFGVCSFCSLLQYT